MAKQGMPTSVLFKRLVALVLPSAWVLALAILVPFLVLFFSWTKSFGDLLYFFNVANKSKQFYHVLVVLIPLGIAYVLNGSICLWRHGNANDAKDSFFICGFFIPASLLSVLGLIFAITIVNFKDAELGPSDFAVSVWAVSTYVFCLFAIDVFLAIYNEWNRPKLKNVPSIRRSREGR